MGGKKNRGGGESGQYLVLGALLMVVMLGFTALAVDTGFYLRHRAVVQQAVDAAALAGAQELPDDQAAATAMAELYAENNGVDPSTLDVTFRCTSTFTVACDPAADRWDTIEVGGTLNVPFFVAPVMKVVGISGKCWLGSCPVVRSAAACRGLCGGDPTVPVDVVMILDRTGSMSNGDLANAKNAAETLLETFNPEFHRVGLAILGAGVSYNNPCQDALPGIWLPVGLSDDYQTPSGQMNNGSRLVNTINCLVQSSQGTDLGDPLAAAIAELQANGRPDVTWGIIMLTDGAANEPQGSDVTGWHNCSSNVAGPGGDGNGYQQYPWNACTNGSGYARDWNSGTSTSTNCSSSGNDRHVFYDYDISLPAGATVTGIQVRADVALDSGSGDSFLCVELSWDGGSTWTSAKKSSELPGSWTNRYFGGNGDTWGRTWSASDLSNGNFRIRVTDASNSTSRDFFLDWITPRIYYSSGFDGPCEFAAQQADLAKSLDIEMYTIGYGTDDNSDAGFQCGNDTGAWQNVTAEELLRYMATDENHFFQEAQGEDLAPIFQIIAQQLAGGSRLIQ